MRASVLGKQQIIRTQHHLEQAYKKSIEEKEQTRRTQKVIEDVFIAKGCLDHELS